MTFRSSCPVDQLYQVQRRQPSSGHREGIIMDSPHFLSRVECNVNCLLHYTHIGYSGTGRSFVTISCHGLSEMSSVDCPLPNQHTRELISARKTSHKYYNNNNNNNILYSSQREIKAVVRSHNEEHISIILSHETHAHTHS